MWNQNLYIKAWNFASKAHAQQFLPASETPYINHVGLVAMEVMAAICEQNNEQKTRLTQPDLAVVCALLHDTIEDTSVTFLDIAETFGEQVAHGVLALTKDSNLPTKREQMLDSLQRIKKQPPEVSMVKLADRITNLQPPPPHWTSSKINDYRDEARIILEQLGSSDACLAARLEDKIKNYQRYC